MQISVTDPEQTEESDASEDAEEDMESTGRFGSVQFGSRVFHFGQFWFILVLLNSQFNSIYDFSAQTQSS